MNSLLLLFSRMNNGRIMASEHLTADLSSKGFNYNKAALSASNLDNVLVIDCSYFGGLETAVVRKKTKKTF